MLLDSMMRAATLTELGVRLFQLLDDLHHQRLCHPSLQGRLHDGYGDLPGVDVGSGQRSRAALDK